MYSDGSVLPDKLGGGYTGYWGYLNASQSNAAAQTLTMHDFNSYTETGSTSRDAAPFVGFAAGYGTDLFRWGDVRLGWELGRRADPGSRDRRRVLFLLR